MTHAVFFSLFKKQIKKQKVTLFALLLILTSVTGCEKPPTTTLAFVGPTSGRNSDLGINGRNGFILAIEHENALNGINGQPINYIIKDDQHNEEKAIGIFTELYQNQDIAGIIGPMTSAVASSVIHQINSSDKVTISPTVTSPIFSEKDDNFFRILASTDIYSAQSAAFLFQNKGIRTVSTAFDSKNASYSKSWHDKFNMEFKRLGGETLTSVSFESNNLLDVSNIVNQLVSTQPDAIIIVANSLDTALIIQQIRQAKGAGQVILTAEWAGTERLLELAGQQVEGVYIPQYIDRLSQDPEYLLFKSAYNKRFSAEPGFASITSYNATSSMIKAIQQKQPNESLKSALLRIRNFGGIQTKVNFDKYGDNPATMYMVRVEDGSFVVQ